MNIKPSPLKGKKRSKEFCRKVSEATKKAMARPEVKQNQIDALARPDVKAKCCRPRSPEVRQNMIRVKHYDENGNKRCCTCKQYLPVNCFNKSKTLFDKLHQSCKTCVKKIKTLYYHKHKEKIKARSYAWNKANPVSFRIAQLVSKFKIKRSIIVSMLKAQNNCCAICGNPFADVLRSKCLDHNHKTGTVREFLCPRCNQLLAGLEDVEFRIKAEIYLEKHENDSYPTKQQKLEFVG
jgi:hypothetical protein